MEATSTSCEFEKSRVSCERERVNVFLSELLVVVAFIWVGIYIPKDADFADKGASQSKLFYMKVHFCHGRMPCPPIFGVFTFLKMQTLLTKVLLSLSYFI
jgi:hypothetical protein